VKRFCFPVKSGYPARLFFNGCFWRKAAVHAQTASRRAYLFGIRLGEGLWSGVIIHRSNFVLRKQAPLKLQSFIRTSENSVYEKSVPVQSALKKVTDDIWQ
jgi:hypothetical protein